MMTTKLVQRDGEWGTVIGAVEDSYIVMLHGSGRVAVWPQSACECTTIESDPQRGDRVVERPQQGATSCTN